MLKAILRDIKVKPRTFRNKGMVTGTIKRVNGEVLPICLVGYKVNQYVNSKGLKGLIDIDFMDEELKVCVDRALRHPTYNTVINIDFIER